MLGKKVDRNQAEIVDALRKAGAFVVDLSQVGKGIPDLLVCAGLVPGFAEAVLLEVKASHKDKLTPAEAKFFASYPGRAHIVTTAEEAMKAIYGNDAWVPPFVK